ncbi:MAG: D-glycerate dehydrogenase [Clostridia bacterium]|nr:D-glycerate dehydrogenase [Clostridia bacterium]
MATILITHGIPTAGLEGLAAHRIIMPAPLAAYSMEELQELIPQADAVIAGGKLPAEVIRAGKRLKIIANYGAGYDSVDIAAAAECGIPVTNIPDTVTDATAELAIGLMLAVSRRIGEMNLRLRREASAGLFGMGRYMGSTLQGRTLGIIGYGRIGRRVGQIARALGMRVVACSRRGVSDEGVENVSLEELLSRAEVVSLHCPLTEQTRHLLDREAFGKMKPGAMLVNTARGGIVDHDALTEALRSGKLAGAGLDVYPQEPSIPEELLAMDNVVCTPHVGANTAQTREAMAEACAAQILDALAGRRPVNIVNGL